MAWLDIFRKKEEKAKETIKFEKLKEKLEEEIRGMEKRKEETKNEIINEISDFDLQARGQIARLEKVNLESRKEQENVKLVVKEYLALYINYVKKLLLDLNSARNLENEEYIKKLNQIVYNFERNSKNPFEKATILIGKEMGEMQETAKKLFSRINNILRNNLSEKEAELNKIRSLFEKLDEIKKNKREIDRHLESLGENKIKISEARIKRQEDYEEFKKSEEYKRDFEEKEKKRKEQEKINKEIFELKQKLDLRKLGKFFHNDLKKSEIIKEYAENFKLALEKDSRLEIINLTGEFVDVSYIKNLRERIQKIFNSDITGSEKKINIIEEELRKISSELISIDREIVEEEKKKIKLDEKKKQISEEIKKNSEIAFDININ